MQLRAQTEKNVIYMDIILKEFVFWKISFFPKGIKPITLNKAVTEPQVCKGDKKTDWNYFLNNLEKKSRAK